MYKAFNRHLKVASKVKILFVFHPLCSRVVSVFFLETKGLFAQVAFSNFVCAIVYFVGLCKILGRCDMSCCFSVWLCGGALSVQANGVTTDLQKHKSGSLRLNCDSITFIFGQLCLSFPPCNFILV